MTTTLLTKTMDERGVCTLTLNRPDKHNALNSELITSLLQSLHDIENDDQIRVVVLTGSGSTFCSGADIESMRAMANNKYDDNLHDALQLARLFQSLYQLNKPTIAVVNGSAFGGAIGLVACCDIAIAVDKAKFAFTEVRLGIVPAVISPYITNAIGTRNTKRLFISAEKFLVTEALRIGLVSKATSETNIDLLVETEVDNILQAGPKAIQICKKLINSFSTYNLNDEKLLENTAKLIAQMRISDEGQEGLNAFLEKRSANWLANDAVEK